MLKRAFPLLLLLLALPSLHVGAQPAAINQISYGQSVEDAIDSSAFFDWWQFEAVAGDQVRIVMQPSGGLAPLIGLLDTGGDIVARSEDGAVDETLTLEYTIPADGLYIVVASRVGRDAGTTTGSYTLSLVLLNADPERNPQYQDVTWLCRDFEVTTVATIEFSQESDGPYSIFVYGLDGFQPVLRIQSQSMGTDVCHRDASSSAGDVFTFPGQASMTLAEDQLDTAAQLILTSQAQLGNYIVTIGSADDQPGRYLVVIGGFQLAPEADQDVILVRQGPRAAQGTSGLLTYMIGVGGRLDPFMSIAYSDVACDDAGQRSAGSESDCEMLPSPVGLGAVPTIGGRYIGDRFDAGLLIPPGDTTKYEFWLTSRSGSTRGEYALALVGELPPRPPAD
jgi:hypothetical protein